MGDALSVVEGLCLWLEGTPLTNHWDNQNLWQRIWEQVTELQPGQLKVQHVTSHLDVDLCDTAFEDWAAQWNQHGDTVAAMTNTSRTWSFQTVLRATTSCFQETAASMQSLRSIYFQIAEQTESSRSGGPQIHEEPEVADDSEDLQLGQPRAETLVERLPLTWKSQSVQGFLSATKQRTERLLEFIVGQDASSTAEFRISWLELVAMFWVCDSRV